MLSLMPVVVVLFSISPLIYAQAIVIYPNDNPTVNVIDTIDVVYSTQWAAANLTVFCENNSSDYTFYHSPQNPIGSSGTFALNDVQGSMNIPLYPVPCHLMLQNFQEAATTGINGGDFTLTSTAGAGVTAVTYQLSSSASIQSITSASSTSIPSGITDRISSTTPTSSSVSISGTGIPSTSSPIPSPTSALSTVAKAGIGIGISIAALLMLAAVACLFISHRRKRRAAEQGSGLPLSYEAANKEDDSPQELDVGRSSTSGRHELG